MAFEHLLTGVVEAAEALQRSGLGDKTTANLKASAHDCLRLALLTGLSELVAPALYERFAAMRNAAETAGHPQGSPTSLYERFVAEMKAGGFRQLFDEKPVLLRLIIGLLRPTSRYARQATSAASA